MQEKSKSNNFFQCLGLGICHRLFNFIVSLTGGLKRVTATCHPMRQGSTAVPIITSLGGQPNWAKVEVHQAQIPEAHETGPVKMESVEEQERIRLIREKKGKSVVIVSSSEEEEVKLRNYPPARSRPPLTLRQRQVRPLFDVAANINEKSDAFIRSRKEAMRRNYNYSSDMETCQN